MAKITNTSKAKQGLRLASGKVVWIDPGESKDIDYNGKLPSALKSDGGKKVVEKAEDEPASDESEEGDRFSDMTDDELRAFIEEETGDEPHHRTGRPKLLEMARKV